MERLGGDVTGLLSRDVAAAAEENRIEKRKSESAERRIRHWGSSPSVVSLTDGRWRKMTSTISRSREGRSLMIHHISRQLMRQPDTVLKPKKCRLSQFHWIMRRNSVLTPRGKYFNYKYKYCSDLFLRVTEVWIRCRVVAATIDAIQIFWICLRKIISFYDKLKG